MNLLTPAEWARAISPLIVAPLFDEYRVFIHPDSLRYGGAWRPDGTANEPDLLRLFYEWGSRQTRPFWLLDIGASTGAFALLATHLPLMHVIAFEPVPVVRALLETNIALNQLEHRVMVRSEAVGAQSGSGTLHIVEPDRSVALSMLGGIPAAHKAYHNQTVRVVTIDDVTVDRQINAIKIDVEGGELAVLQGGVETLKRDHPALMVENNYENTAQYGRNPHTTTDFLDEHKIEWIERHVNIITKDFVL